MINRNQNWNKEKVDLASPIGLSKILIRSSLITKKPKSRLPGAINLGISQEEIFACDHEFVGVEEFEGGHWDDAGNFVETICTLPKLGSKVLSIAIRQASLLSKSLVKNTLHSIKIIVVLILSVSHKISNLIKSLPSLFEVNTLDSAGVVNTLTPKLSQKPIQAV